MSSKYYETRKKYYIANKEKVKKYRSAYHKDNIDKEHSYNKWWRENNKDKIFKSNLRNAHGITIEMYNKMFNDQDGCCWICGKHQDELKWALHVDHDHETGEIRGLLCRKCNSLLGYAEDNLDTLSNAINYLTKREK